MSALHYPDRWDGQIDRYGGRIDRRNRLTDLPYLQFLRTFRFIVLHLPILDCLAFCNFAISAVSTSLSVYQCLCAIHRHAGFAMVDFTTLAYLPAYHSGMIVPAKRFIASIRFGALSLFRRALPSGLPFSDIWKFARRCFTISTPQYKSPGSFPICAILAYLPAYHFTVKKLAP